MGYLKINMNKIKHLLVITFLLPVLYNCATSTSSQGSKPSASLVSDSAIEDNLQARYSSNDYKSSNIYINSYDGAVLLTGQVPNAKAKEAAEFDARATPGTRLIYDYLDIRLPQSLSSKTTDSYTTTQVKGKILNLDGVSSNSIKVVTTNNVVYLAGVVTKAQAAQVANAAASVNGVDRVVTLFDYINR